LSQSAGLPKDEQMALTRDGLSRDHPDELLGGFFAAWPAVLWILSGNFAQKYVHRLLFRNLFMLILSFLFGLGRGSFLGLRSRFMQNAARSSFSTRAKLKLIRHTFELFSYSSCTIFVD
jgi:hypothetical protein